MIQIKSLKGRQILDSRGNPTVEVDLYLASGEMGRAAVPSGASTGAHEAHELRDKDPKKYFGKGVLKAVEHVNGELAKALVGKSFDDLQSLDRTLVELDGTESKKRLGANALLGVSLAAAHALASLQNKALFEVLGNDSAVHLPVPLMNVVNGGAHANNNLDVQEFMIAPVCGGSFSEALRAGVEVFHTLKTLLNDDGHSTAVGDEGGFAPNFKSNEQGLEYLMKAINKAGYEPGKDIYIALDVAASELYRNGAYSWEGQNVDSGKIIETYDGWSKKYPIVSIEDGLDEDDWQGWVDLTKAIGDRVQLVGDDLFVTNIARLAKGVELKAANALLVKVNQIGTLTEASEAVQMAHDNGFKTVMSHRSGETEDATIADLSVGLSCHQIKTGSLCRGERTAKYNQLLRIEEQLGNKAKFRGLSAFE